MNQIKKPRAYEELLEENQLLSDEVYTARRAAELTAMLVVEEIRKMEEVRKELQGKNEALQQALNEIDTLRETLPICAHCKSIRDDEGYWQKIEIYLKKHSGTDLTHGLCPGCEKDLYGETEWYKKLLLKRAAGEKDNA